MTDKKLKEIIHLIETEKFKFGQLRSLWFAIEKRLQSGRRKKKMLNEFPPKTIDFCKHCGAALINSEDWIKPRWEDDDCWSGCLHEAANDPELEELVKEIDEIANRINESTRIINELNKWE